MLALLLHEYVGLVALSETDAEPLGDKQLVLFVDEHVKVGFTVAFATTASQVAVQPVPVSVTITVYVPAASPLILELELPLLHE